MMIMATTTMTIMVMTTMMMMMTTSMTMMTTTTTMMITSLYKENNTHGENKLLTEQHWHVSLTFFTTNQTCTGLLCECN